MKRILYIFQTSIWITMVLTASVPRRNSTTLDELIRSLDCKYKQCGFRTIQMGTYDNNGEKFVINVKNRHFEPIKNRFVNDNRIYFQQQMLPISTGQSKSLWYDDSRLYDAFIPGPVPINRVIYNYGGFNNNGRLILSTVSTPTSPPTETTPTMDKKGIYDMNYLNFVYNNNQRIKHKPVPLDYLIKHKNNNKNSDKYLLYNKQFKHLELKQQPTTPVTPKPLRVALLLADLFKNNYPPCTYLGCLRIIETGVYNNSGQILIFNSQSNHFEKPKSLINGLLTDLYEYGFPECNYQECLNIIEKGRYEKYGQILIYNSQSKHFEISTESTESLESTQTTTPAISTYNDDEPILLRIDRLKNDLYEYGFPECNYQECLRIIEKGIYRKYGDTFQYNKKTKHFEPSNYLPTTESTPMSMNKSSISLRIDKLLTNLNKYGFANKSHKFNNKNISLSNTTKTTPSIITNKTISLRIDKLINNLKNYGFSENENDIHQKLGYKMIYNETSNQFEPLLMFTTLTTSTTTTTTTNPLLKLQMDGMIDFMKNLNTSVPDCEHAECLRVILKGYYKKDGQKLVYNNIVNIFTNSTANSTTEKSTTLK